MLIGFGCTVPAVMSSRTLPSARDRKMTIMLTPFMSCTAKLPIYGFFTAAFFPGKGGLIMVGLYFTGIIVGIIVALLSKNFMFKGEAVPFVMELPNYRMPGAKNVGHLLWDKAKDFLQRAFTVIFIASIVVWFLQTFNFKLDVVDDSHFSMLAVIAGYIAPIFIPLGFGDWRISTALIAGFMAKGKRCLHPVGASGLGGRHNDDHNASVSCIPAGVLPALHPVRGGHCLHQAGAGRKMGPGHSDRPVRHRLGLRLYRPAHRTGAGHGVGLCL